MSKNNSTTYAKELKYFHEHINEFVRPNSDKNEIFKKIFEYINKDGSVDLLDLNNRRNYENFTRNITESNIMKSFILNTSYYNNYDNNNRYYDFFDKNKPWGMYFAEDYDIKNKKIYDCSGNGRHAVTSRSVAFYPSRNIKIIKGGINDSITFPNGSIPQEFTIASITRYLGSGQYNGKVGFDRILTAKNIDWFHGHNDTNVGVCKYSNWETQQKTTKNKDWVITIGKNGNVESSNNINNNRNILINGNWRGKPDIDSNGNKKYGIGGDILTINGANNKQHNSDWALICVIIWDKNLNDNDLLLVNDFLKNYMESKINKEALLIPNPNIKSHCNIFNDSKYKYNFLLSIITQLYSNIIEFRTDLTKTNIINLLQNNFKFTTDIKAIIDRNKNLILSKDGTDTEIIMNNLNIVNNNTTKFIKSINNGRNIEAYNKLFNLIKTDFLNHLKFIKLYDMFNAKIYYYYYTLCSSIFSYNDYIFTNTSKVINVPYNYTPLYIGTINKIENTEYSYIVFDKINSNYNINILNNINCDILVVGGGGGGGNYSKCGGGGGGGDVKIISNNILNSGKYLINVGNGGLTDMNGGESSIIGISDTSFSIISYGGKSGGINGIGGIGGGSGGGNGGIGKSCNSEDINIGGIGNDGTISDITGKSIYYGGGGGGGSKLIDYSSSGGQGGGGIGGSTNILAGNGMINLGGGGGGGGSFNTNNGGSGGSGIVIIKIETVDLDSINMLSNDIYESLKGINDLIMQDILIPNNNASIIAKKYSNIGKIDKKIKKINMNINRKNIKFVENSKTINTSYIELLAITILSITIISIIYLSATNNNKITILYGSILLLIVTLIFLSIYIYLYYTYNINENFSMNNDDRIIKLFKDTFKNINHELDNSSISNVTNITKNSINLEENNYINMLDTYTKYDKKSLQESNIISLENKNNINIIILLFIISIILLSSLILYTINNNLLMFIIIIDIILIIISIYNYYYTKIKYVNTETNKYYWKKP